MPRGAAIITGPAPARPDLLVFGWLSLLLGASVLGFGKLAEEVSAGELTVLDDRVAVWLHAHAGEFATGFFALVTKLGGTTALLVVSGLAAGALAARRRLAEAALVVVALAGAQGLNWVLKALFERPRPAFADPISTAAGFSFPSAHAMVAVAVYGAIAFVLASHAGSRRTVAWIVAAAVVVVGAVGLSRMYLGVHYLSDVLAGYAAGVAWLTVCLIASTAVLAHRGEPVP